MIDDLEDMATGMIKMYQGYRTGVERKPANPKRIIFYRDGVSEGWLLDYIYQMSPLIDHVVPSLSGEFAQVLQKEVPLIKGTCHMSSAQDGRMRKADYWI